MSPGWRSHEAGAGNPRLTVAILRIADLVIISNPPAVRLPGFTRALYRLLQPSGIPQTMKASPSRNITFAVAVNNREVFENNFLGSPCLRGPSEHQVLVQEGYNSAAKAYNSAIDRASHDLVVLAHQDIFLPETWVAQLNRALDYLEAEDPQWGVLGCYGETLNDNGRGHIYSSGLGTMGRPFERPAPVQTLDEIVLILRKSSGLRFDEGLPHFHLYGTDICLRAGSQGMKSYAICAFCIHNTHQSLILPREFYDCCKHIKRVWKDSLPIQTTCIRLTRSNLQVHLRRAQEFHLQYIRRKKVGGTRVQNVQQIVDAIRAQAIERPQPDLGQLP